MLPSVAAATGGVLEGNGSEETPYLVTDYADLKMVGTSSYSLSAVYRLKADIDASPSAHERNDSGFLPIGNYGYFRGNFHGCGHLIKNLTIRRANADFIGLFGKLKNATIDTLGLIGNSITGRRYVGTLAGHCDSSTITYCYTSGLTHSVKNLRGQNISVLIQHLTYRRMRRGVEERLIGGALRSEEGKPVPSIVCPASADIADFRTIAQVFFLRDRWNDISVGDHFLE